MKIFVKISLFGLITGVSFFGGYQNTYAACAIIPTTIIYSCSFGDTCDQVSCKCQSLDIANWVTCDISLLGDGNKTTLTSYGVGCSDVDWCLCPDLTPLVWPFCVAPVVVAPVIASLWSPSVVGSVVNFSFSSDKVGTVFYVGSCWAWSISSAVASSNTVVFNLPNTTTTYNNCKIYVQDASSAISNMLDIPSFSITATTGTVTPPTWGGWWWGGTPTCYTSNLICENGIYVKKSGVYCSYWDLWKKCTYSWSNTGLYSVITNITWLTITWFENVLSGVKNNIKYTSLKEYTVQGIKIKLYVPKFTLRPIASAINSLTRSFIAAVDKKLIRLNDYSYVIENYETIGTDQKIIVYKEIWAMTRLYNDMMTTLYMVLDMKKAELLPVAKYYLTTYINEIIKFKK